MPLFLPIKQRALRKEPEVEEDPITRKISNGVLIIATGLLIILIGIFLCVIGNRKGSSQVRLFGGIAIIVVGMVTAIGGGFLYAIFWRKKNTSQECPADEETPNSPEGGHSRKMLTRAVTSDDDLSDNDLHPNHKVKVESRALSNQGYTEMKTVGTPKLQNKKDSGQL